MGRPGPADRLDAEFARARRRAQHRDHLDVGHARLPDGPVGAPAVRSRRAQLLDLRRAPLEHRQDPSPGKRRQGVRCRSGGRADVHAQPRAHRCVLRREGAFAGRPPCRRPTHHLRHRRRADGRAGAHADPGDSRQRVRQDAGDSLAQRQRHRAAAVPGSDSPRRHRAAHLLASAGERLVVAVDRGDAAQHRDRRPHARHRPQPAASRGQSLRESRARRRVPARRAQRIRPVVVRAPDSGRHDRHLEKPARHPRHGAPSGRCAARGFGGAPRTRLSRHGHAFLATGGRAGGDERGLGRALFGDSRRGDSLRAGPLRPAGGAARPDGAGAHRQPAAHPRNRRHAGAATVARRAARRLRWSR